MHCAFIRVHLHHYRQLINQDALSNKQSENKTIVSDKSGESRLKANDTIKQMFVQRTFKWKTLKNNGDGTRIEILEGLNLEFKEQLKPETAFLFRRGLNKNDILRQTLSLKLSNTTVIGDSKPVVT